MTHNSQLTTISLTNLSKKYNQNWVFKGLNTDYPSGTCIQITGGNGAGKSTLLKILGGMESPTEGKVLLVDKAVQYNDISLCAPYQSLYNDLSLEETFTLTQRFRKLSIDNFKQFVELLEYPSIKLLNKPLSKYSSGMRQRVKVLLACAMESKILLLDEPTSNLDVQGIEWYNKTVQKFKENRIIFVATNDIQKESQFCTETIAL